MSGFDYPPNPDPSSGQYPPAPPPDPGYAPPPAQPPPFPYPPQGPGAYPPQPFGAPQPYPAAYGYAAPQQGNGMAVAALVLGILSLILSWLLVVDFILAVLAIIFGAVGLSAAAKRGGAGRGMAIAGLILGALTIVLGIIFWIVVYGVITSTCGAYGC
jgi:hypothetical protein